MVYCVSGLMHTPGLWVELKYLRGIRSKSKDRPSVKIICLGQKNISHSMFPGQKGNSGILLSLTLFVYDLEKDKLDRLCINSDIVIFSNIRADYN